MKKEMDSAEVRRKEAAERLRSKRAVRGDLALREAVHELEVHQIELQMQNEDLPLTSTSIGDPDSVVGHCGRGDLNRG